MIVVIGLFCLIAIIYDDKMDNQNYGFIIFTYSKNFR